MQKNYKIINILLVTLAGILLAINHYVQTSKMEDILENIYAVWVIDGLIMFILLGVLLFNRKDFKSRENALNQKIAFETLFEKSSDAILIIENDRFVQCNEKALTMFQYHSKEEFLNVNRSKLSPKRQDDGRDSHEKSQDMIHLALQNNGHIFEWTHTRADGEIFWTEILLTPLNLDERDIMYVVLRDISDRKELKEQSEHLLRKISKEQEILLSLFDKGDNVLFNWRNDEEWSVQYVSKNVKTLLDYEMEEFESHKVTYAQCIHENDINRVMQEVSNAQKLESDFFKHTPYRVITKAKGIKWVLDYTVIVRDDVNNITNFIGYILDITELKQKDQQLLEQSRLAQMGEMISMIAHQWRQPLAAIASTTANLETKIGLELFDLETQEGRKAQNDYFSKKLEAIGDYVDTLTTTIDDFRNFYKPNKVSIKIDLKSINEKALGIINASLILDGIKVIFDCQSEELIDMYENEMMQVVLNIFKNSQDNFQEKEIENPKIYIETKGRILKISDNGGGIEEQILEKVFDPYFSTKDEKNGTGLGLYMSKTIVEEHHNGRMFVANTDNGVCFTIDLNVSKAN